MQLPVDEVVVTVDKQLSRLSGIKTPKACDQCTLLQTANPAQSKAEPLSFFPTFTKMATLPV